MLQLNCEHRRVSAIWHCQQCLAQLDASPSCAAPSFEASVAGTAKQLAKAATRSGGRLRQNAKNFAQDVLACQSLPHTQAHQKIACKCMLGKKAQSCGALSW